MSEKKSFPETSAVTRLLYAAMAKMEVGKIITRDDIMAICKADYEKCRGPITSAKRMCLRDDGIVFGAVSGVGYRRLDQSGIVGAIDRDFRHIHRTARRGVKKAAVVTDPTRLPAEERNRFFATASCLAALEHATRDVSIRRLSVQAEKSQAKLPMEDTIKAFM